MLKAVPGTMDDLARQFTQLNSRWSEVVNVIDERYKMIREAVQQYTEFRSKYRDTHHHHDIGYMIGKLQWEFYAGFIF